MHVYCTFLDGAIQQSTASFLSSDEDMVCNIDNENVHIKKISRRTYTRHSTSAYAAHARTNLQSMLAGVIFIITVQRFDLNVVFERLVDVLLAFDVELHVIEGFLA